MRNSWIKLYTKLESWGWYREHHVMCVFIDLLIHTNYDSYVDCGISYPAGTQLVTYELVGSRVGYTAKVVKDAFDKLRSTGEIECSPIRHKRWIVRITNWYEYQSYKREKLPLETDEKGDFKREKLPLENDENDDFKRKKIPLTTDDISNDNNNINTRREKIEREFAGAGACARENDNPKSQPIEIPPIPQQHQFRYPETPKEVIDAATARGYRITEADAIAFIDHYSAVDWMTRNGPIRNWQCKLTDFFEARRQINGQYRHDNARDTGAVGTEADFANDPYFTPADQAFK